LKVVHVKDLIIGGPKFTVIAGPCLAESLDLCEEVAETIQKICYRFNFNYIFKSSFDKANRSSISAARGRSTEEGLQILDYVKSRYSVPITTDIHIPQQAKEVASVVDLMQIPAFLARQTDLLEAAALTGKPVNVKKAQFIAAHDAKFIIEKLEIFGASGIMLTERGTMFGYNNQIVDMYGLEVMRNFGYPVCYDATHSVQKPGGGTQSGGNRQAIPALTRAATAVGIDAIFMEVHPDPENALSDSAIQWPLHRVEQLLEQVATIREALNSPVLV
jgi:2-dehydro-3-deoxyphosphooctonate aldolase (KDO 8-P synthase)